MTVALWTLGFPTPLPLHASPPKAPLPEASAGSPRWTPESFGGVLSVGLEGHRSFEKGRALFRSAGCAGCHVFEKDGTRGTRDLSGFCRSATPEEVLNGLLLAPSHRDKGRPLADRLEQDQILDLLAFLLSGANPNHSFFHRGSP